MSDGHWGYQSHFIREGAEDTKVLLEAAADSERIIDWALSADTSETDAKEQLWKLWIDTFDKLFGDWER